MLQLRPITGGRTNIRRTGLATGLVLFLVAIAPLTLAGQSGTAGVPDTPAAKQFFAWLAAFNSGDATTLGNFLKANFPEREDRLNRQLDFRNRTGGFEFKRAESSSPTKFTGVVQERNSDQVARFTLEVEEAEPHRIINLQLNLIPPGEGAAIARMPEADLLAALRARLGREEAAGTFSGSVLVAKGGKPVFAGAYGLANREARVPNTLETRFRIGSMNKMFTAIAILQLVEAGKIALGDALAKYLPNYPNQELAAKVTIQELLTHTGGTGDFFGPEFDAHRLELRTLEDYVKLYGKRGPAFEPGSRWEYSNYGFLLLGVVIEKVSGRSYYDYVEAHVFKPAGMTSTGSLPEDQKVADRSIGYTREGSKDWSPNTDTLPYRGTSAGGGYSTVGDLGRFGDALLGHKLLNAANTELLTTGKVETPRGDKYAYGFVDSEENGMRCFGHGGGAPGMNGDLRICPGSGYVVAVLSNLDPPAAQNISTFVVNRLPAK